MSIINFKNSQECLRQLQKAVTPRGNGVLITCYDHETEYGIDVLTTLGHISFLAFNVFRLANIDWYSLIDSNQDATLPIPQFLDNRAIREYELNSQVMDLLETQFHNFPEDIQAYILYANSASLPLLIRDMESSITNEIAATLAIKRGLPENILEWTGTPRNLRRIERKEHSDKTIYRSVISDFQANLDVLRRTCVLLKKFCTPALQARFERLKIDFHVGSQISCGFEIPFKTQNRYPRRKEKRSLRKRLLRGMKLFSCVNGGSTDIRAFINGQEIMLQGHLFDYFLTKKKEYGDMLQLSCDNKMSTIPYNLWVADKKGNRIARLCIYIPNTPIIDQIVALSIRIRDGEMEAAMLSEANIMEMVSTESDNALFMKLRKDNTRQIRSVEILEDPHQAERDAIHAGVQFSLSDIPAFREILSSFKGNTLIPAHLVMQG